MNKRPRMIDYDPNDYTTKFYEDDQKWLEDTKDQKGERLANDNGAFESNHKKDTIGYHFESLEWIIYHTVLSYEEKVKTVTVIQKHLSKYFKDMGMGWKDDPLKELEEYEKNRNIKK